MQRAVFSHLRGVFPSAAALTTALRGSGCVLSSVPDLLVPPEGIDVRRCILRSVSAPEDARTYGRDSINKAGLAAAATITVRDDQYDQCLKQMSRSVTAAIRAWQVHQSKPKAPPKPPQKTPLLAWLEERYPTPAALTAALHGDGNHIIREMPDRLLPSGGADIRSAIMRGLGVTPPKRPRQPSAALVAAAAANPQFFASHAPSILARASRHRADAAAGAGVSSSPPAEVDDWPPVPADLAVQTDAQYHSCIHSISLALGGFFGSSRVRADGTGIYMRAQEKCRQGGLKGGKISGPLTRDNKLGIFKDHARLAKIAAQASKAVAWKRRKVQPPLGPDGMPLPAADAASKTGAPVRGDAIGASAATPAPSGAASAAAGAAGALRAALGPAVLLV